MPRASLRSTADDNRFTHCFKTRTSKGSHFCFESDTDDHNLIFTNCLKTFRLKFLILTNFAYFCMLDDLYPQENFDNCHKLSISI